MQLHRLVSLILIAGLLLAWLLGVLFFPAGRPRLLIAAVGVTLFLLTVLTVSISGAARWFKKFSKTTRLTLTQPIAGLSSARQSLNEAEFVSETFKTVVSQLQTKQNELNQLHSQLTERAASAEAFNQHVIASLPTGLIAFDLQGLVRVINQPAKEIFSLDSNLKVETLSYQNLFSLNPSFEKLISDSLSHNKFITRHELDYQTHSGRKKRLGVTVAPLEVFSEAAGVLCLAADLTEINRLREQLALQHNLDSLGLMSAGLAHEFKNSLAAIHVYAQFINRQPLAEKGHEAAAALMRELRGLSEMVTAFLDFSRPKPITLEIVSLSNLISESLKDLAIITIKKDIKIKIEGDFPNCPADPILLRQVINNLLHNSFEAVENNSQSDRLVEINGCLETDENRVKWAKIEIKDNGGGIKPEDLPFVFVPFFTTKQKGNGIGLALSHRIVTQHQGLLSASQSDLGGAVLTLKLKV